MNKIIKQLMFVIVLAFLALAQGAQPALASDVDVPDTTGFGAVVSTLSPNTNLSISGQWNATLSEQVFQNGSVFTYVFTLANDALSKVGLSQGTTASLGSPNLDLFDSTLLNWGVVASGTTAGADDRDFTFGPNSTTVLFGSGCVATPTDTCSGKELLSGSEITFYLQSALGPGAGTFGAQDGGVNDAGPSLDPGPEPSSILLFGTGVLVLGAMLRRRLPQLSQPL